MPKRQRGLPLISGSLVCTDYAASVPIHFQSFRIAAQSEPACSLLPRESWKEDGGEGIVAVGDTVERSVNNTSNRANNADYTAKAGGTFPGLPQGHIFVAY